MAILTALLAWLGSFWVHKAQIQDRYLATVERESNEFLIYANGFSYAVMDKTGNVEKAREKLIANIVGQVGIVRKYLESTDRTIKERSTEYVDHLLKMEMEVRDLDVTNARSMKLYWNTAFDLLEAQKKFLNELR